MNAITVSATAAQSNGGKPPRHIVLFLRRNSASRSVPVCRAFSGVLRLEKNRKQLRLGFDPQLAVHVFLMDFHGFYGDLQLTGDFFTGATAEHQTPDIQFPGRQLRALELLHRRLQLHSPVDLCGGDREGHVCVDLVGQALAQQAQHPWLDQRQQSNLFASETFFTAQRQAQRALALELAIELDFVGDHIQTKVSLVILGQLEMLRRHLRQGGGGAHGSFATPHTWRLWRLSSSAAGDGFSGSGLRCLQAAGRLWRIGNSTRKVVPTPGSLRTEMSPPCFFTMP